MSEKPENQQLKRHWIIFVVAGVLVGLMAIFAIFGTTMPEGYASEIMLPAGEPFPQEAEYLDAMEVARDSYLKCTDPGLGEVREYYGGRMAELPAELFIKRREWYGFTSGCKPGMKLYRIQREGFLCYVIASRGKVRDMYLVYKPSSPDAV